MAQTEEEKAKAAEAKAAEEKAKAEKAEADKKAKAEAKAKEDEAKAEKPAPSRPVVYFRNRRFARESINFDSVEENGHTRFMRETFVGYKRRVLGEEVPFGYLATTNPAVIKVCRGVSHIDEISKSEYDEETNDKNNKIRRF